MVRVWGARAHYLVATLLMVSFLVIPTLGLQSSQDIQSHGTIGYSVGLLYGACAHPWYLTERDFQEMQTLGVKYVRMDFNWQDFEKTRDAPYNFDEPGLWTTESYDTFVNWAKTYGIDIIAVLKQVPNWVSSGGDVDIPPTGSAFDDFVTKFGQWVYAVVNHYKGDITRFEIWNEPNVPQFWNDPEGTRYRDFIHGEATRKYVTLLKEAYAQAKAANPNCKIISGGIGNDHVYLQEMYSYGAKDYFDVFGSHPYFDHSPTKNYDVDYIDPYGHEYHFPKIQYMRDVMITNGDEAKRILITELGVDGKDGPEGPTTEEIQADRLARVFEKTEQEFPYVEGIMWYQFRDSHAGHWGLFLEDYTPRQMYHAYKQLIAPNPV